METETKPIVLTDEEASEYLEVALAETFSKPGTADVSPEDRKKLAGLLKYYAKKPHPFTACRRDQMKHGLPEEHANRRCAVIKDLIEGNTHWRNGGGKKHLSEEEQAGYALDIPEEFATWLSETDADAVLREAEEQQEKEGILFRLKSYLGLGPDEEDDENQDQDANDDADSGEDDGNNDSSEEAEEGVAASTEPETVNLAYQLPYDLAEPEKISRRLWRKHLLPLGKKINYRGTVLDFSAPTLRGMVESAKRRAFDAVYVTVGHTRDADKGRGVLKDLFIKQDGDPETDGLYGDFELSEEGENIIRDNLGAIGTSVSYHPNYTREADGEKFGPAIQHVAFTPTPHVPGLKPWEAVQMSELETEPVDLTDAEYAAPDSEAREGNELAETHAPPIPKAGGIKKGSAVTWNQGPNSLSGTVVAVQGDTAVVEIADGKTVRVPMRLLRAANNTKNGGVEMEVETKDVVSLEEFNALKAELEAERSDRQGIRSTLRNQGINGMLNRMVSEGKTTPPKAEAAKVLLSALQGTESDVIELSGDGAASVTDGEVGKAVLELLAPGAVPETGERGRTDLESRDDMDEEDKIDLEVREYCAEHSGVSYEQGLDVVLAKREAS